MSAYFISSKIVQTICDGCMCQCGALVHVNDGKALKIEGDPGHPSSQGFMCPKGLSYLQTVYHPDRVIYPMKRIGQREITSGRELPGKKH